MEERRISENQLLRRQCEEIRNYADQFPPEEKDLRMLEWIENYAQTYRENMEKIEAFVARQLNGKK